MDNNADYIVDDYSDYEDDDGDENSSSSDDEIQALIKRKCGIVDIKDDFEDEMDKVMAVHLKKLDKEQSCSQETNEPSTSSTSNILSTEEKSKEKTEEEKNDELFYDPDMDKDDEKWIQNKRRSYIYPSTSSSSLTTVKPLPNSDAVLNCPACLALLCLDCQKHAIYKNQYRAMFVSNCNVITDESLLYPTKKKKRPVNENDVVNSVYNPVRCVVCNTEVAVYDSDEVYHFFNVLASYA